MSKIVCLKNRKKTKVPDVNPGAFVAPARRGDISEVSSLGAGCSAMRPDGRRCGASARACSTSVIGGLRVVICERGCRVEEIINDAIEAA